MHLLARRARQPDPGLLAVAASWYVSGSAQSVVPVGGLGREGVRFTRTVSSADDIAGVTGTVPVAHPIRIFVGLDAAATPEARVAMAIAEMHRTGAADRRHLLLISPAGTGYANPTPVQALELLSGGDCASIAVAFGVLPSFLSTSRVPLAARTQRLLLAAVAAAVTDRDSRPRLLLYGESLGATAQVRALPAGLADLDRYGVTSAVWVGTPGGAERALRRGQVASLGEGRTRSHHRPAEPLAGVVAFDDPRRSDSSLVAQPRIWLLEHDDDPVVLLRPDLLWRRPSWLPRAGGRGGELSPGRRWWPVLTWLWVLRATIAAGRVVPGEFTRRGHDYRADLARTVATAYRLPATAETMARCERRLRDGERDRAARIAHPQPPGRQAPAQVTAVGTAPAGPPDRPTSGRRGR